MSKLAKFFDKVRESDVYHQIKSKYDELDSQAKVYVNLGGVAALALVVLLTVFVGLAKVNGLKSRINENEETIGYLQRSADTIRQLKAQQSTTLGDVSSPLPTLIDMALQRAGLDPAKADIGAEHPGAEEKESVEMLLDVKLEQVNLRQLSQFLFVLTEQGSARKLNIKNLVVDTKNDPSGWLDASVTVAAFKAK